MVVPALLVALASSPFAGITSLNLADYSLSASYPLPGFEAAEASAVTFNWDTGNLVVLGDEGDALAEVTTTGALVSSMTLTGFDDTEGLTYIGGGQFALNEERLQDVYRFSYSAGGSFSRGSLQSASLGPTVGNVGIEGISYEPSTGTFFAVKEKSPQAVLSATVDFANASASVSDLFIPSLGTLDLSDIQVLSTVASLTGTADQDNLLILSQESNLLLEVSRTGAILSQLDLSFLGTTSIEGVTIGADGTIYLVDESPRLFALVPSPTSAGLLSMAGLVAARRRRVA